MCNRRRKGMTLIEIMIVLTILTAFSLFAFSTLIGTINVTDIETTRNDMDTQANAMLGESVAILAHAILPVTVGGSTDFQRKVMDTTDKGFGRNGTAWRTALQKGVNAVPFAVMVDRDGSGDRLDGNLWPYLGAMRVDGSMIATTGNYDAKDKLTASINADLADLTPAQLADASDSKDFSSLLAGVLKNHDNNAFAIIRFVPSFDSANAPVTVKEADLKLDLDENGISTDVYRVGHLEVYYPGAGSRSATRRALGGRMVLVKEGESIFQLAGFDADGKPVNSKAQFMLRVRLLICDIQFQQGRLFTKKATPALARFHESMVEIRNMSM